MVSGADASLARMKFIFAMMLSAAFGIASAQAPGGTYRVRPGESLASIANTLVSQESPVGADKPSVAQRMVAIYRANPKAFAGSMNQLLDGSELRLPSAAEIAAVNPTLARLELADQTSEYLASKPRSTETNPADADQIASTSDEQVIAGLQKTLRRKERELAALRTELAAQRELLPAPTDGSHAAAPVPGKEVVKAELEVRAKVGEGAGVSASTRPSDQMARGVLSPSGLAVAGAVALLGGFGLLWFLRGRVRMAAGSAGFTQVTVVPEVRGAANSVVEAEVLQRMPDLSGFSGLGSATPRARDPSA